MFERCYAPQIFEFEEITTLPPQLPVTPSPAKWYGTATFQQQRASVGDFLVRNYDVSGDEYIYRVVRAEHFATHYFKGVHHAQPQPRAEANNGSDSSRLETAQGLASGQDSEEGREGVQRGRLEKVLKAKGQEVIAVVYSVAIDGWIDMNPKYLRNSRSPLIVWMTRPQWTKLANCATREGEFYIPCTPKLNTNVLLRRLLQQMEAENESATRHA